MRRALALILLFGLARADLPPTYIAQIDAPIVSQSEETTAPTDEATRKRIALGVALASVIVGGALGIVGANATEKTGFYGQTVSRPNALVLGSGIGIAVGGIIAAIALWPTE